ncbi:leukocyte elastase inhibitor-like [Eucyclogobius newberryi]|uniref:leukocyte elastase inhibitor-like n=1 Tax=Eucyclogobius newberryi TaxID=166745 RepID=UPI003B595132
MGQASSEHSQSAESSASENLSKAHTSFTLDLFRCLREQNQRSNVLFSPLSISAALSMVLLGAKGRTAKQMRAGLKTKDCKDVHSSFAALLKEFKKADSSFVLSVANRLYGEQSCKFIKTFLEGTRKYYDAELETVNFMKKADEARIQMNSWVEEQTQGKMKHLLVKDAVDSTTKLVLVNAIYLKADWGNQFDKELTKDGTFRLNKRESKTVRMMQKSETFKLRQVPDVSCQVLELPYKRRELSMLIILPNDIEDSTTGLQKLEMQLTYENFVEWTHPDKMAVHQVDVRLPRFRIEENYELSEVLKSVGMDDAFDQFKCDFSGMSPTKGLVLSRAVHRAFVDVNEAGTEAGAATMVLAALGSSKHPRATFNADHPFLFFIRHNATGTVLFAGRFCSEK